MDHPTELLLQTRRHFFGQCGLSLGAMALLSLPGSRAAAAEQKVPRVNPLAPRPPHFPPKVKRVIYLFMAGGPSQLELFDPKPELTRRQGQPIPASFVANRRFAFIPKDAKLLGSKP